MTGSIAGVLLGLVACTGPDEPEHRQPKDSDPPEATGDTGTPPEESGTTGTTGDTGTPPEPTECDEPPVGPFTALSTSALFTEEDFDFDVDGYMITQSASSILATDRTGASHVLTTGIGGDFAGIRSLSTGDIMLAQPSLGSLQLVNHTTGGFQTVVSGLTFPNGLEATDDGLVFASEYTANGRILLLDPYTGTGDLVAQIDNPNNMALAPDGNTLFVAAADQSWGGDGRVVKIVRDKAGVWGTPEVIYVHSSLLGGITTDSCGHVYAVGYSEGTVFRILEGETTPEVLAVLGTGSWSSMRFGSGIDAWGRSELFITDRSSGLHVIDVEIDGRHALAP